MNHIKLFAIFEKEIYNSLDEIAFSDHWKNRTGIRNPDITGDSRVLPRNNITPFGFSVEYLIDDEGTRYSINDIITPGQTRDDILRLISTALYRMTRGVSLQNWNPNPENRYGYILDLGRIALTDGNRRYYIHISGGNPGGEDGRWDIGDKVFGFADKRYVQLKAITLKYYPSTADGLNKAREAARKDSGMSPTDFYASSRVEFPYGRNFVLLLDLSDPSAANREEKIRSQLRGEQIILGPAEEIEYEPIVEDPITRKTISPEDRIGLFVKYANPDGLIMGRVKSILNIKEIQNFQKLKSLSEIKEIKISFLPEDQRYMKKNEEGEIVRGADGNPLQFTLKIVEGSKIIIDDIEYTVLGEAGGKPLITSEPSILNKGSVQTWVKRV
jgi:hypothetical protein